MENNQVSLTELMKTKSAKSNLKWDAVVSTAVLHKH